MSYHALRYRTEKAVETAGFLRDECRAETQRQVGGLDLGEAGQMNVARLHQRRELGVKTLQLLRTYTAHQYSAVSTITRGQSTPSNCDFGTEGLPVTF